MKSVKTRKTNKVGKNTEMVNAKTNKETHFKQVSAITNTLRSIGGIFTKIVKKVRELFKKHPKKSKVALVVLTHAACKRAKELDDKVQDKSKQAEKENQINWWKYSGLTIATSLLLAACSVGDIDKQIELEQEKKEAENARDRANKSGIELEQEKQKTIKEQKGFIKDIKQNCKEEHGQFFIRKGGIKAGMIEVEAECKTPKPAKTNQTPIQPKHLPNSKQPRSQRGSKAQELIAYLQKELESLPYSQKAIAKQVNFYRPSSIAYLELDPRDFKVTEEWQNENLKIRSKAQAKMLEMRNVKPDPQAHLSTSQSLLFVQKIFADINKEIKVVANTEKKAEKAGYGYSKRV
ncbi:DUF874 family protein [Helicobacter pylori]|uniref:DUF874 family protein n=1 Tax=Helicobacter pylori (strain India7) TaxID=907238 RepID=E8QHI4_HELP7|nr:DUF874 family protein [Helicobacter pylori]ADU80446.1 hypothetical protein HPIN_06260 [Helicobacter pylori India7]